MATDRVMTYDAGRLRFAWNIVSRQIEVYQMTEDGRPEKRLAWLLAERDSGGALGPGGVIEFEREPFEALCDEFLQMAATAEIRDEEDTSGDED